MLRPRRYGLLVQRDLTCIFGHRIKTEARPFEIAIPCNWRPSVLDSETGQRAVGLPCDAQLYIFNTRAKLLWAMDITLAESAVIEQHFADVGEIIDHFGVGFPVEMKIARLKA